MILKPRILISGSSGSRINYERAVAAAGGEPYSFYCPPAASEYDALLLCGGDDVDPAHFGQENRGSEGIDRARDAAELALAELYLSAGKPVLGICRGHQLLNIALGGTLIQDLSPELQLFHTRFPGAEEDKIHPVRTAEDSLLHRFYGAVCAVNSSHHQVVDQLGHGLWVTARSEAGIVEAMEHRDLPVLCVQFHPERMTGEKLRPDTVDGGAIFAWLIARCRCREAQGGMPHLGERT